MPSHRHHSRRTAPVSSQEGAGGAPPETLFAEQLPPNEPATPREAMAAYVQAAIALGNLRPWEIAKENQAFAVDPGYGAPRHYCSFVGEGGVVLRMVAYEGDDGYRLFRRMTSKGRFDPFDLFTSANLLYVDYCAEEELEDLDAELLQHCGVRLTGDAENCWPVFRTIRCGYREWYPNAYEMLVLGACMLSGIIAAGETRQGRGAALWRDSKKRIPLVGSAFTPEGARAVIQMVDAPSAEEPPWLGPPKSVKRIEQLKAKARRTGDVWELGCAAFPGVVGQEGERGRVPLVALAAEAGSGFVFPPVIEEGVAMQQRGRLLAKALLEAIGKAKMLPRQVRLESETAQVCLAPLAGALGIELVVKKRLKAIDDCLMSMRQYSMDPAVGGEDFDEESELF